MSLASPFVATSGGSIFRKLIGRQQLAPPKTAAGKRPPELNDSLHNFNSATQADTLERRNVLEKKLQAQLRNGGRSKNVKSLRDPLVRHLLRVAGNASYRSVRGSVIVTGTSLITELLSRFPCKRVALRRQTLLTLRSSLPNLFPQDAYRSEDSQRRSEMGSSDPERVATDSAQREKSPLLSSNVETHYVSNRILRKVAGLHSYDDGCIAEMRMPEPAESLGNIRLLLCLGSWGSSTNRTHGHHHFDAELGSGAVGGLIRTSAALNWQGIWALPSCPDIFSPLAIRASQGALFWLPYRTGTLEELVKFCREEDLAVCVPHVSGAPMKTVGLFRKYKGVCLVIDSALMNASWLSGDTSTNQYGKCADVDAPKLVASGTKGSGRRLEWFRPDMWLSLGDIISESNAELVHPLTTASLMLYHIKQTHFPSLHGSSHMFTIRKRLKALKT